MRKRKHDDLQALLAGQTWQQAQIRSKVTLPSDYLSQEALLRRNGPCRSYQLGKPMTAAQLQAMPEDLQKYYLRCLRRRGGSAESVCRMLGLQPGQLVQLSRRHRVCFDQPNPDAWQAFLMQ